MNASVREILINEREIAERVGVVAKEIDDFYKGRGVDSILVVAVLRGAFVYVADLLRKLKLDTELDFVAVSSYHQSTVSGILTFEKDITMEVKDRHVLLVDDIVDTGKTLTALRAHVLGRGAASCLVCTLLDKPGRRETSLKTDFCGFVIPDKFVVGYGLDFAGRFRGLPYVGVVEIKE